MMNNKVKNIITIRNLSYAFNKKEIITNINLSIKNETYCLLGESGSGKTTLAKVIATLYKNYSGEIFFKNFKYDLSSKSNIRILRKKIRLIFQSPETTLNPRMSIYKILKEPLNLYSKNLSHEQRIKVIRDILDKVKLSELKNEFMVKSISQLSGGQKRRVAIARAIISKPEFIIADEPTEGLDISLQGGIIELFRELKIPMLLITHNYAVAAALASKIGIMYKGEIVEEIEKSISFGKHPFSIQMKKSIELLEYS